MGKYNFTSQKIAELEKRLSMLEQANDELRKENAELRNNSATTNKRELARDLTNYDKCVELWGYEIIDGKLTETNDRRTISNGFATLHQNVARALMPVVYKAEASSKERIRGKSLASLSEEEYAIFLETLEACIETIYYAKQKMKGENKSA